MRITLSILLFLAFSSPLFSQLFDAGQLHSIVICKDSTVWVAGQGGSGALGQGNNSPQYTPIMVPGLPKIVQIDVYAQSNLATDVDSTAWFWGYNLFGAAGNGTTGSNVFSPYQIPNLGPIIETAAGPLHSMLLQADGTVWTTGDNQSGELGSGNTSPRSTYAQIANFNNVVQIEAGHSFSLFLKSDSTVWACGRNTQGQVGQVPNTQVYVPTQIQGLQGIVRITEGSNSGYALRSDSTVWGWGRNSNGQLGDSSLVASYMPVQARGINDAVDIAAGIDHLAILRADGTIWVTGSNGYGQHGDGTNTQTRVPVQGPSINDFVALNSGYYHVVAVRSDSSLWGWGKNDWAQLMNGVQQDTNVAVKAIQLSCKIAASLSGGAGCTVSSAFSPSGTNLCQGDSLSLTNMATGGSSYTWEANGQPFSTDPSPVWAANLTGQVTISLIAGNGNCQDTSSQIVTVNSNPTVSIFPNNPSICQGDSLTLTASGAQSYIWNGPGLNNVSGATVQVSPSNTGSFMTNGTDGSGCAATASVTITVNPNPTVNISNLPDTLCEQDAPIVLVGNPSGGSFSGPGVANGSFNPAAAGTGNHAIQYAFTDNNGCFGDTSQLVEVLASPLAQFTFQSNQLTYSFTDQSTGNPSTWSWNFGDGNTSGNQNPAYSFNAVGPYEVCLTVTEGSCTDSTCQTIQVTNVGIKEGSLNAHFSIAPNPFETDIQVFWDQEFSGQTRFSLVNTLGMVVWSQEADLLPRQSSHLLSAGNVAPGIYFLIIEAESGFASFLLEKY